MLFCNMFYYQRGPDWLAAQTAVGQFGFLLHEEQTLEARILGIRENHES